MQKIYVITKSPRAGRAGAYGYKDTYFHILWNEPHTVNTDVVALQVSPLYPFDF